MNRESKLHGNAIYSDCENLIKALDAEILNFNDKIDALKDFTDNDSEGNSVKAMNAKCLELSSIIEKMIEADRKDIRDLIILKNKVQDVYIDGADVLDKMEEAERGARECFDKATSLEHAADLAEFTWEADYLRGLASASRSYGESWMRLYTFWGGQAELYDEIDEETSSLFSEGREYHRQADAMIETFLQCRLTSPGFTVSKSRKISKSRRTSINGVSEEEIYKYDHDYLLRNGFSEEQIEYLYRTKPELFSSLYITAQRASDSCPAIIQNMREELNKVVVKYQFLVDDIKKRWNLSDEEATIVLFKLEKHHRLESFYGTYYHSQTEYYTLLDNLAKRCDSWANDHLNELNKTSFAINWNEEEKEKTLSIYYWKYVFCADENIENGKEIESDNCKFVWEDYVKEKNIPSWYGNPMRLDGNSSQEKYLARRLSMFNKIPWNQEKVDQLWKACEVFYNKYGINLDPRILLAIIIQEGTGSFNTNSIEKAGDGGNGPESDYILDLMNANNLIFGKIIGYIFYKEKFQQSVKENGELKNKGEGDIFDYFNWNTPIVEPWNNTVRFGVYADDPTWSKGVKAIYEMLTYDGAAEDYSKSIDDIDKDKTEELKKGTEIPDYDF